MHSITNHDGPRKDLDLAGYDPSAEPVMCTLESSFGKFKTPCGRIPDEREEPSLEPRRLCTTRRIERVVGEVRAISVSLFGPGGIEKSTRIPKDVLSVNDYFHRKLIIMAVPPDPTAPKRSASSP